MANEPHTPPQPPEPAQMLPPQYGPENPEVGHEESDINIKWVLWFGAGLLALAIVIHLGLAWMFFAFKGAEEGRKASDFPPGLERPGLPERPWLEQVEIKRRSEQSQEPGGLPPLPPTKEAVHFGGRVKKGEVAGLPVDQVAERMAKKLEGREGVKWSEVGAGYPSSASSGRTSRSDSRPRERE